ncbi:MAG: c-type cytochrome [Verrucomicrobia bacterium]|nr:c-type cytochrome [Verrucomicrobiota bacterium]
MPPRVSPAPRLRASLLLLLPLACHLPPAHAADPRGDNPHAKLLPAAESRAHFHLPPGFEIQLVAAEPDLEKPFNLAFDSFGRVWVTGSKIYPWPAKRDALGEPIASFEKQFGDTGIAFRAAVTVPDPPERGDDTVRILSDFDPATGRARKSTVFADGLNIPVGILPLPRGQDAKGDTALVFSIPAIWRLTDTDGDGRADVREKLYDGFGFKDTHGMSSSYWLWFDGWVYGTHGFANASEVVDRQGRVVKLTSGNTYRFRPDGSRFEVFVNGQTNPYGLAFDARGDLYTADSHSKPVYLLIPGGYYEGINKEHDGLGFAPPITLDDHGSSAIAGIAHYSAAHFPPEFRDNLFNGNPVTRRINRTRLEWRGSTPNAARQPDFLTSDDPAFRPVQVKLGPDGALWIADFYNPIIGHYEAPLTHPARDHAHGRIWRIVWRGLDGNVPLPSLPNLAQLIPADVVTRITDSNLVVRSLAFNELFARDLAAFTDVAASDIAAVAAPFLAGNKPTVDETAALPLFFALDRLSRTDEPLLRRALTRPDSNVAIAALRVLTARDQLPADAEELFSAIVGRDASPRRPELQPTSPPPTQVRSESGPYHAAPGLAWRIIADALRRHPQPWGAPHLLHMLARAPDADTELVYALRLALKAHARDATAETLAAWAAGDSVSQISNSKSQIPAPVPTPGPNAARVADLCLALPTPAAARFLIGHVRAQKNPDPRIGDFAKHIAQHLPAEEFESFAALLKPLSTAPALQRLAAAEGLASLARPVPVDRATLARPEPVERAAKPGRTLPAEIAAWMQQELFAQLDGRAAESVRASNALRPLALPEKAAPLRRIALGRAADSARSAALRALAPGTPDTEEVLLVVLNSTAAPSVRRVAAELLAGPAIPESGRSDRVAGAPSGPSPAARAALGAAFTTAPADLALTLAISLAKSDAGAADLLDLAAAGKVRPALLKHRYVAQAFEKRSAALRDRVAALTQSHPPEDARLDAVIAARLGAAANHKPDATRGAPLFATHCATCHRFRDQGGNLGPSLDGIGSRSLPRLVEDILDPSRNVDPVFRLVTVTLKNGDTKSGLNLRDEGDRTLLTDPATQEVIALAKADIAATTVSPVSAMPAAFETVLSEKEFFDLLEYLRSPAR